MNDQTSALGAQEQESHFCGVGIVRSYEGGGRALRINYIAPKSDLNQHHINVGDRVLAFNELNKPNRGWQLVKRLYENEEYKKHGRQQVPSNEDPDAIKGEYGTTVLLRIQRSWDGTIVEVPAKRQPFRNIFGMAGGVQRVDYDPQYYCGQLIGATGDYPSFAMQSTIPEAPDSGVTSGIRQLALLTR